MEEIYTFEFWRYHFNCDNFKPKHYTTIRQCIENSYLGAKTLIFGGDAIITFDPHDDAHKYPIITVQKKFTRGKINCIVYNINPDNEYSNKYDKLFIYYSEGINESNYGFVFYNTHTGKLMHKYFVEAEYDILTKSIKQAFIQCKHDQMYDFYAKHFDACKYHDYQKLSNVKDEQIFLKSYKPFIYA